MITSSVHAETQRIKNPSTTLSIGVGIFLIASSGMIMYNIFSNTINQKSYSLIMIFFSLSLLTGLLIIFYILFKHRPGDMNYDSDFWKNHYARFLNMPVIKELPKEVTKKIQDKETEIEDLYYKIFSENQSRLEDINAHINDETIHNNQIERS